MRLLSLWPHATAERTKRAARVALNAFAIVWAPRLWAGRDATTAHGPPGEAAGGAALIWVREFRSWAAPFRVFAGGPIG